MEERIQKILSGAGICSRRKAEEYLNAGRVQVNGRVAALGEKADPQRDHIQVDGVALTQPRRHTYLMLHKPRGYVTTLSDEKGRKTVAQLVADCGVRVWPVGRLDMDSEGLLLLTNDGPLAHRLLSPRHHVDKTYFVRVDGALDREDAEAFAAGMTLADGLACLPAGLELLDTPDAAIVTLREGKYHQIKRMLAQRGKPVVYLKRLTMGPLSLDPALEKGEWRPLTAEELAAIRSV